MPLSDLSDGDADEADECGAVLLFFRVRLAEQVDADVAHRRNAAAKVRKCQA